MAQLLKKFIAANAVDETKIRLSNNANLRARNAANSGDVSIFKVNASDRIEFASVPQSTSDASAANDLVRYSQISGLTDGMKAKQAVAVASTADIDLSVAADPSPIDGYTLAAGDRILLKDQTAPEENGIYDAVDETDPTTWTRSSDYNDPSEIPGSYTVAEHGTVGQGVLYVTTSSPAAIGTDPIVFVARSITSYTGGDMITLTGSAFSVDLASNSGLESTNPGNTAGQLRIKSDTTTANTLGITLTSNGAGVKYDSNSFSESSETLSLASGVAGDGLSLTSGVLAVKLEASNPSLQISSDELGIKFDAAGALSKGAGGTKANVDGSTIEIATNALQVKDLGITTAKIAAAAVDENKIASSAISATGALNGGSGTKLSVKVDASTVKINGSNNLESLKEREESITLSGTDITNQYVDLAHAIYGASASENSASVYVVGGPMQQKTVDYTVSLTGGSGGVTRITFAGDLATGGAAELVATDVFVVKYSFLT